MPPDHCSSRDAFDANILNSQVLDAPDGLETALRITEAACRRGDPEILDVVMAVSGHSHILEYIISGM